MRTLMGLIKDRARHMLRQRKVPSRLQEAGASDDRTMMVLCPRKREQG